MTHPTLQKIAFTFAVCAPMALFAASCSSSDSGLGADSDASTDPDTGSTGPTTDASVTTTPDSSVVAPPSCTDKQKNGDETDVDCGGSCSTKCGAGKTCSVVGDCSTGACTAGTCAAPSCTDSTKNGSETDVDCGGTCTTKCDIGKACKAGGDCTSTICGSSGTCIPATCGDSMMNGTETDIDCGGSCSSCADTKKCAVSGDCTNKLCDPVALTCTSLAVSCADTKMDGSETDTDCGGLCSTKCADTKKCLTGTDCVNTVCAAVAKTCSSVAVACADGLKNGNETDIDCGGACSTKCADTKKCLVNADCKGAVCDSVTKTCALYTGLLGYWNLDDAAGSMQAADSAPNNLPAGVNGSVTFVPGGGVQGGAAQFVGAGSLRAVFPNNARGQGAGAFIPQGNLTFAMWFKTAAANQDVGGLQTVIGNQWGGGYDRIIGNASAGGGGLLNYNIWSEENPVGKVMVNDGKWHHMVYVTDKANGLYTYIDGALETTDVTPTSNCGLGCSGFDWASEYWFGTGNNGRFNAGDFTGSMDEVRLYNRALSATDVMSLYKSTKQ